MNLIINVVNMQILEKVMTKGESYLIAFLHFDDKSSFNFNKKYKILCHYQKLFA